MNFALRRIVIGLWAIGLLLGAFPTTSWWQGANPPVAKAQTLENESKTKNQADPPPLSDLSQAAQPAAAGARRGGFSTLPSGANVAIIPVHGDIYDFVFQSLQRRVQRALAQGATAIVLEINTNGGLVTTALDIAKFLKDPTEVPVPTVAWVHPKAYSAGILIASACDQIVMAPSAATGDCAPIVPGRELAPTERAKAFSPIAAEFKSSATQSGYTYASFHAMCVLGVELYLIENPDTGERLVVNQADFKIMVEGDDTGLKTGGTSSEPGIDAVTPTESTTGDLGLWKPIETLPSGASAPRGRIHDGNTLFTIDAVLASDIGLSKATLTTDAAIQQHLGAAKVFRVNQSWSENAAGLLSTLWVRLVLVLLLVVGIGLELASPGLGVPGALAIMAAVGLFGAPMIIGLAELWHVLLFVTGLGLVVLELTTAMTAGALLVVGALLMLVSLVLSVVPSGPGGLPAGGTGANLLASAGYMVAALGLGFVGLLTLTHHLGRVPGFDRLVLANPPKSNDRPAATLDGDTRRGHDIALGTHGTVTSTLRPGGTARFGDNPDEIDVISSGTFIQTGAQVVVIEVNRFELMVEEV
ncbi:MAG: hypothetical protein V3V20_10085 [Algisphaera sp.]